MWLGLHCMRAKSMLAAGWGFLARGPCRMPAEAGLDAGGGLCCMQCSALPHAWQGFAASGLGLGGLCTGFYLKLRSTVIWHHESANCMSLLKPAKIWGRTARGFFNLSTAFLGCHSSVAYTCGAAGLEVYHGA